MEMDTSQILQNLRDRTRPSQWGALPLFIVMLVGLRLLTWEARRPSGGMFLFFALLMAGCYFLGPLPWQWTGDRRTRVPLRIGSLRSILWSFAWMGLITGGFAMMELALARSPAYPSRLLEAARRLHVHPLVLLDLFAFPLVFLAGWLISEREMANLERIHAEVRQRTLEASLRQAEARALQAELDPHVLYNALGGLAELARRDPAATERALLDFSDYYRKVTECARRGTITLREERVLLELFLAIERIRFGDRLRIRWAWPEDLDGYFIPSLLLQPLVENAVKHGIAPVDEGGEVHLEARKSGDRIRIAVENDGAPLQPGWRPGVGLTNLAGRLANLDPRSRFHIEDVSGRTRAEIDLPAIRERAR